MITLTPEQIKDIAGDLDAGFDVYLNIHTKETIRICGDEDDYPFPEDDDAWAADQKKVEKNSKEYYRFEKMSTRESFLIMEAFAYAVDSKELRKELITALSRKGPFRNFKYAVDSSGEYRQQWFDFKDKKIEEYVS